jgi:uncharacterized protein (TIGR03083 family)
VDLLPLIADERRRVARLVEGLTPAQLAAPSLCEGWTVRDVAGYLLMPLVTPLPRFMLAMARSGFNFDRANRRQSERVARRPVQDIADGLRRHAGHPFKPPGMGHEAPLSDLLIHQQDIRRPLGLPPELEAEKLTLCLRVLVGFAERGSMLVPKGCTDGLRLEASDLDWARGEGPAVRGTGEALLLALAGRSIALAELDGEGADLLRSRLTR